MISNLRTVAAWASVLLAVASSHSVATKTPPDDTGGSNSILVREIVPWLARDGMTSAEYQDSFGEFVHDGYRLTYVSGYTIGDDPRFASVWDKDVTVDWVARHGMTSTQYQNEFNAIVANGFRPRLVNGCTVKGEARFVALWDKSPVTDWVARHDMSSSQYQSEFNKFVSQGFRLTHVSGYAQGNQDFYAALWEKPGVNVDWVAHHAMTSADYQKLSDKYVGDGFRTVLVNGYVVNNVDYYVAIWDKSPAGSWLSRHGMTSANFQAELDKWTPLGYHLTVLSGYTLNSNDVRYAAIFVHA